MVHSFATLSKRLSAATAILRTIARDSTVVRKVGFDCSVDATPWTAPRRYTAVAMKAFYRARRSSSRLRRVTSRASAGTCAPTRARSPSSSSSTSGIRRTPMWSPDGRHVVFIWERAGVANIYVADDRCAARRPQAARARAVRRRPERRAVLERRRPRAVRSAERRPLAGADRRRRRVRRLDHAAAGVEHRAVAGRRRAWRSCRGGNDLVVRSLADGQRVDRRARRRQGIGGVSWSPDGARLVFNAGAQTIRHEQTPDYSGTKIIYTDHRAHAGRDLRRAGDRRHADAARRGAGGFGARRWLDARALPRRSHVARFQAAHDLASPTSPAASRRRCTRTSTTSSGASPATPAPARSRRPTASGSRSSAIATAGITST